MLPQSKPAYLASPRMGLVVDPDAGNRDQCRSILRPIVQDIVYAEDGREALALAIGHRPRFVITATGLRFIDGYTLCSLLRAEPLMADVPIVLLTGDTTPDTVTLARSSGADRVVARRTPRERCCRPSGSDAIARGRPVTALIRSRPVRRRRISGSSAPSSHPRRRGADSWLPLIVVSRPVRHRLCRHRWSVRPAIGRCRYVRSHVGGVSAASARAVGLLHVPRRVRHIPVSPANAPLRRVA